MIYVLRYADEKNNAVSLVSKTLADVICKAIDLLTKKVNCSITVQDEI